MTVSGAVIAHISPRVPRAAAPAALMRFTIFLDKDFDGDCDVDDSDLATLIYSIELDIEEVDRFDGFFRRSDCPRDTEQ